MAGMYGHTWTSAYGDSPSGTAADTWASALTVLSPEQLANGLRACVAAGGEFPPSAPRFRAMCFGIPSFEAVNAQILTGVDRSPFAILVWSHVDSYQHRHARADEAKRMRRAAYDLAVDSIMRGEPLPPVPAGLVTQEPDELIASGIPTTPEARAEKLAKLLGDQFNPDAAARDIREAEQRAQQRLARQHQAEDDFLDVLRRKP